MDQTVKEQAKLNKRAKSEQRPVVFAGNKISETPLFTSPVWRGGEAASEAKSAQGPT